ncbi:MAG: hypothetical protein CSA22_06390 [Deltaproteobacteria bacterium]|nr:MAG: hypothetical protein CSA22_06390 [Deltaproteobacteria bacterium]
MPPNKQDLDRRLRALVHTASVMTLASVDSAGPWASPVYFLYDARQFFFYSAPDSRHIRSTRNIPAAASVHADSTTIKTICGLQMNGRILAVTAPRIWLTAGQGYIKKFSLSKTRIPSAPGDMGSIRLYAFIPESARYLDNGIRFGYKTWVKLP